MEVLKTQLEGVIEFRPNTYADERGWFMELFNQSRYGNLGVPRDWVQDNISSSEKNVLRGLHFQAGLHAQAKLVTVLSGKALDVVVDLRKESPTFGKHLKVELDSAKKNQLFIPKGMAHGFLCLEPNTIFHYKCDSPYHKESERTLLWNDPHVAINWGTDSPILSTKDEEGSHFSELV